MTTFAELGVPESIGDALSRRGIETPFEIQAATIADALAGRDVLGRAPTGAGKTLAFGIPLVANIGTRQANKRSPLGLVLAPTRELADQIHTELRSFAGRTRIGVVYGGVGYGPQRKALNQGVDILVACPGRLEDLIQQGDVKLSEVTQVVLDEADRMADMGFMPAVRRLLDQTADDRQTVLFSATLDGDVAKLTKQYQNDPVRHEVGEATPDITLADHVFWKLDRAERVDVTADAVNAVWPAIIFCRTRHGSDRLAKQLAKKGLKAAAIHGGRSQAQRTRALEDFAKSRVHALVATDVAARGIHVDGVASVIHYDPPEDHKTYVHRSGRTARAGESGVVVSLLMNDQLRDANRMQKKLDLDEPVTTPNAIHLRELSDAPVRELAPARPERGARKDGGGGAGRSGNGRPSNRSGRQQAKHRTDRPKNRSGNPKSSDRDRRDHRGRDERSERPQRSERSERSERPQRSERYDRTERAERAERAGSAGNGSRRSPKRNEDTRSGSTSDGSNSQGEDRKSAKPSSRSGGKPGSRAAGSRANAKSGSRYGKPGGSKPGGSKPGGRKAAAKNSPKSRTGKKARHPAGIGPKGPNRKARRAHLQPESEPTED